MSAGTPSDLSKRDRQRQRRQEKAAEQQRQARRQNRQRILRNIALGVVAAGVLVALALWLGGGDDPSLGVAEAEVASEAEPLPPHDPSTGDPAVGQPAPTVTGENPDGEQVTIGAGADGPQAIGFMAHWCPHCQDEVPEVVEWAEDGAVPDDVELVAVSSRHDPARPNWPPDEWLENEGWPGEVLIDSTDSAADAYALGGTPYWVFVDADGNVAGRVGGRIPREQFEEAMSALSSE